jgi:hypothetical protein
VFHDSASHCELQSCLPAIPEFIRGMVFLADTCLHHDRLYLDSIAICNQVDKERRHVNSAIAQEHYVKITSLFYFNSRGDSRDYSYCKNNQRVWNTNDAAAIRPAHWNFVSSLAITRWVGGIGNRLPVFVHKQTQIKHHTDSVDIHELSGLQGGSLANELAASLPLLGQSVGCAAYFAGNRRYRHENHFGLLAAWQLRHVILALAAKSENFIVKIFKRNIYFSNLNSFTTVEQTPTFWRCSASQ